MPVYLLTCPSDVKLFSPLLPLAGVAAALMDQCCSRSVCRDAEVNLTREGLKPTCAISFGTFSDFPDLTSFICKALNLFLNLTLNWNVQMPRVRMRKERLCSWPRQWSRLCFWREIQKNSPPPWCFLKNARNVDERAHHLSPTSHRCAQLKSMVSCFLWRALADAFAAQNGLNQRLTSVADNSETGSMLLSSSWFQALYLASRRTFVVLTDRMRVDVPKGGSVL